MGGAPPAPPMPDISAPTGAVMPESLAGPPAPGALPQEAAAAKPRFSTNFSKASPASKAPALAGAAMPESLAGPPAPGAPLPQETAGVTKPRFSTNFSKASFAQP